MAKNVLSENIKKYRAASGMTQEKVAEKLSVTYQAVSKWESGGAPDVALLPAISKLFGCSIDSLFTESEEVGAVYLPWKDDDTVRGVVFKGRKMIGSAEGADRFTFDLDADIRGDVKSEASVFVNGNVGGSCSAGGNVLIYGDLQQNLHVERGNVRAMGDIYDGVFAGGDVTAAADISGDCAAGGNITAGCDIEGNCTAKGDINIGGQLKTPLAHGVGAFMNEEELSELQTLGK